MLELRVAGAEDGGDGVPSTRLNDDVKDLREWLADYPDDQRFSKVTRLLDELKVNI